MPNSPGDRSLGQLGGHFPIYLGLGVYDHGVCLHFIHNNIFLIRSPSGDSNMRLTTLGVFCFEIPENRFKRAVRSCAGHIFGAPWRWLFAEANRRNTVMVDFATTLSPQALHGSVTRD